MNEHLLNKKLNLIFEMLEEKSLYDSTQQTATLKASRGKDTEKESREMINIAINMAKISKKFEEIKNING